MKHYTLSLALAIYCGLLWPLTLTIGAQPLSRNMGSPDSIIVIIRPTSSTMEALSVQTLLDQFGALGLLRLEPLGIDGPLPGTPAYLGTVAPEVALSRLLDAMARSPLVLRAEPNVPRQFLVTNPDSSSLNAPSIDPLTGPNDPEFQAGNQSYYFDIGAV